MTSVKLTGEQLEAIADCVDAIVSGDKQRIAKMWDYEFEDLYCETRGYGRFGSVDLIRPPGHPADWDIDVVELVDTENKGLWIVVAMWTVQEGRSDLSLQFLLSQQHAGKWTANIISLRVL